MLLSTLSALAISVAVPSPQVDFKELERAIENLPPIVEVVQVPVVATTTATTTPKVFKKKPVPWAVKGECVRYLREAYGVNIRGHSWLQKPNLPLKSADVGDVLLLRYNIEHVALIVKNNPKSWDIVESNYVAHTETARTIQKNDKHLIGALRV